MQNIFNFLKKNDIGNPPWDYYFLQNLDEKEYPQYLAKIFNYRTGDKLPLKYNFKTKNWIIDKNKCKTFNQKMQWLKLYGVTSLICDCTDKVKVRDYVKEKIGKEYLKPALQICDKFGEIDFDKLPNSFVLKCNHGCKWQYIIKNKEKYLNNELLFKITGKKITGWLEQHYCYFNNFELNYKTITPKILIEPLMRDKINIPSVEIEIYCFNGIPKLILENADDLINQSFDLSIKLTKKFNFVRVDWMIYKNKLYFEELTFIPYSGFHNFINNYDLKFGQLFNIGESIE